MLFWTRELVGWGLVVIGGFLFLLCFGFLDNKQVVEAAIVASVGIFVFRGGIQLVKLATAGRLAWQLVSARRPDDDRRPPDRRDS